MKTGLGKAVCLLACPIFLGGAWMVGSALLPTAQRAEAAGPAVPATKTAAKAAPAKPAEKGAVAKTPAAVIPAATAPTANKASSPAALSLDTILASENAGKKLQAASIVDDLGYLRRVSVDLIGRIPTEKEIQQYMGWPAGERRTKLVDKLLTDEQFPLRWTVFYGDVLRIRSNAEGGAALTAYVHNSIRDKMPYDELCRQLIAANGKAGKTPTVGFILGDNADPMAMAGVTSQVFMGIRVSCAECHDHPFDVWTREQFYGLAAYFGKTRRIESNLTKAVYTTEEDKMTVLWPPEDKAGGKPRNPMTPKFPFAMDTTDGPHIARLKSLRELETKAVASSGKKATGPSLDDLLAEAGTKASKRTSGADVPDSFDVAGEAKRAAKELKVDGGYRESELRKQLGQFITNPRNRAFSRTFVNRLWNELVGRGFVNPIDDFSAENAPSHPKSLDYLADEFVASGYDLRTAIKLIVTSETYQRGHLINANEATRQAAEEAFVAAPLRRMLSEAMYDSIVLAGHVFDIKHPAGQNLTTTWRYDRVEIANRGKGQTKGGVNSGALASIEGGAGKGMEKMAAGGMAGKEPAKGPSYDLESAIELDLEAALKPKEELEIEGMRKMSNEELEAMQMAARREMDFLDRFVRTTFDDNPRFASALKMAAPAPQEHFLRVFGQPGRDSLGDFRDDNASMRQALMMLNGRLTHEAARVGDLEPINQLLSGDKPDVNQAIRMAYREILTREPTADDVAVAKEIMGGAKNTKEGMHDLRWVLFNCHEFRFLP